MKTIRIAAVTAIVMAAVLCVTRTASGQEGKAVAIAPDTLKWEELTAKATGVMIAPVSGDYRNGAWTAFVKFPAGSKSAVHTHSSDIKIVVVSGTFRYGATPETEKSYGPGSYVFIPANLPHSNSQPQGALLYAEQPGKFDNIPAK